MQQKQSFKTWCLGAKLVACLSLAGLTACHATNDGAVDANETNATAAEGARADTSGGSGGGWLMTYFRQRYPTRVEIDAQGNIVDVPLANPMSIEQLHMALSQDGRHWEPLNGGDPIWDQRLRDPFVRKGPDGRWHLMGTGRAPGPRMDRATHGPVCLHAVSDDLVHWDVVESLPLMQGVQDDEGRPARNIWAPEWFFDETTGDVVLIWSSSFEDAGWKKSKLWFSRTKDWQTFTPAKVLFDPTYSVIDGTLLKQDGVYYLFHKEEEFGAQTGERRAIRVATSDDLEGPYVIHEGPLNDGQIVPTITEGPSVMADPDGQGWLLSYDYCMTNDFGVSESDDLLHWSIVEGATFPADARHGTMIRLNAADFQRLQDAFGGAE